VFIYSTSYIQRNRTGKSRNIIFIETFLVLEKWTESKIKLHETESKMRGKQDMSVQTFLITVLFHPVLRNLEGGLYTGYFERGVKEGSRNGASLYEGDLEGGLL
jgi:hypothetical protein